jgi:hypothetical protein
MLLPPGRDSLLLAAVLRITVGDEASRSWPSGHRGVAQAPQSPSARLRDRIQSRHEAHDGPGEVGRERATSTGTVAGAVVGPRDSGQKRSITVPSGQ